MNHSGKYNELQSAGQAARLIELNKLNGENPAKPENSIRGEPKIVAFGSGKGGTGKSFLSLNTAIALSGNKRILLIDLDLNLSSIHLMLNAVVSKNICDYFESNCSLADLIFKADNKLHFIFGESGKLNHPLLSGNIIGKFFKELRDLAKEYDFIFLDTGSGIGENVINFLNDSDISVIATTPEPTSVMDAYVLLKVMKANSYKGYKTVVINKCSSLEEGKNTFVNLNSASVNFLREKLNLLGMVEYNEEIIRTIIDQTPFMKKYTCSNVNNPVSKTFSQIKKLAAGLVEIQQMANIHQS